jgi:hypothetical protein
MHLDPAPNPSRAAVPAARGRLDPVGAVALLLGGASLLSASSPALCAFVVPLGLLSVLTGLTGLAWAVASTRHRVVLPAAAVVVGAAVLVVALWFPDLLGPAYFAARHQPGRDLATPAAVPFTGPTADGGATTPDWADASKAALQQGGLRVQVAEARVGPVQIPGDAKHTVESYLLIRLRLQRVEDPKDFAAGALPAPAARDQAQGPTLTDDAGKTYRPRHVLDVGGVQHVARSPLFPVAVVEELFLFEPPPAGVAYLRLEVPCTTWGAAGTFRFTIPPSMILRAGGGPAHRGDQKRR